WPQWRGPHRDARATDFKAPKTWPKDLTKKWAEKVGDGVATPALVGDKLYVFTRQGDDEVVSCRNAADGKEVWSDKYPSPSFRGPDSSFLGPRSSPTVAEGKVVTLGADGILSCYDTSGKKLWRKEDYKGSVPRFHVASSPIVVDGLCVAQLGGGQGGVTVAYDLATGEQKWKAGSDSPAYASPVLVSLGDTKAVIVETEGSIFALNVADGKQLWKIAYPVTGRMGYNASTPMVEGETLIYGGSSRGTKAVKLEKKDGGVTAKDLWSNMDNSVQFNTPVLKGGLIYGLNNSDKLFCINAESGKTLWSAAIGAGGGGGGGGRGMGRAGYGSLVDAGSVLLALTPAGQLVVFEPSDKEFKEVAKYKVADGGTYAYPVVSGNRIFIKDRDSLTLWTVE
ncbi:MAG TPA: PQQ-binding-like beta-propeller repeat protein, partial [Gemmataceae bacterium]|nr:PQQ-binding-like beta-propeller repeat protein [Gemmataceae bacterium]